MDPAQAPQIWLPLRMKALITPEEDGLNDPHYDFVQVFATAESGIHRGVGPRLASTAVPPAYSKHEVTDAQIGRHSAYDRDLFLKRRVLVERAATGYSDMRQQYSTALRRTDGDGRPDPPHRLLERREPAHRARRRAAARDVGASGDRRESRNPDRSAADRESPPRAHGCRPGARVVGRGRTER